MSSAQLVMCSAPRQIAEDERIEERPIGPTGAANVDQLVVAAIRGYFALAFTA